MPILFFQMQLPSLEKRKIRHPSKKKKNVSTGRVKKADKNVYKIYVGLFSAITNWIEKAKRVGWDEAVRRKLPQPNNITGH